MKARLTIELYRDELYQQIGDGEKRHFPPVIRGIAPFKEVTIEVEPENCEEYVKGLNEVLKDYGKDPFPSLSKRVKKLRNEFISNFLREHFITEVKEEN